MSDNDLVEDKEFLFTLGDKNRYGSDTIELEQVHIKRLHEILSEEKENISNVRIFFDFDIQASYGYYDDSASVNHINVYKHFTRPMTAKEIKVRDDQIKKQKEFEKKKLEKAKKLKQDANKAKKENLEEKIKKLKSENPELKDLSNASIKKILKIK